MSRLLFLVIVLAVVAWVWRELQRGRQRERLLAAPLPETWRDMLVRGVPLYSRLPAQLRERLHACVQIFLHDIAFTGCGGLEVTDEIRVTIAGNASLLLLGREADGFPGLSTVLVYPDTFIAPMLEYDGDIEIVGEDARAGESWEGGPVILSWGDIQRGIDDPLDGENVVLHEFAHKLDEEAGGSDGLPVLRDPADYAEWADVLTREFAAHRDRVARYGCDVLDEYAATAPAEFFAVATEAFYERGALMQRRLPELYAQLRRFYGVDPAAWS